MSLEGEQRADKEKGKVGIIKKVFSGKLLSCSNNRHVTALPEEDLNYIARTTAISRDQVEAQFQKFIRIHPDGKISKKSFNEMMKECYPGADTEKLSKHIWRMYDTNKDGSIDFREFMVVLYVMSNGTPEENLRQIFRVFDINNDGRIEQTELKRIVKDLFHLLDVDGGDSASQDELVKAAFAEMDEDEDGEITQEEFIKACMQQKKFSTMLTLKIINVFLADSTLHQSHSAEAEKAVGKCEGDKKKAGKCVKVPETDTRRLSTGRGVDERRLSTGRTEERAGKRLGPVRQCTSASSAEGRAAVQEVVRRRGEEVQPGGQRPSRGQGDGQSQDQGGGMRRRREEVETMVVSAHKLQIENKKAQGGDRTPTPGRREHASSAKMREGCGGGVAGGKGKGGGGRGGEVGGRGGGAKRVEGDEVRKVHSGGKDGKRRESKGKETSTRDSLRQ